MELPKPVAEFTNTVMCFYEYGKLAVAQTVEKYGNKLDDYLCDKTDLGDS